MGWEHSIIVDCFKYEDEEKEFYRAFLEYPPKVNTIIRSFGCSKADAIGRLILSAPDIFRSPFIYIDDTSE